MNKDRSNLSPRRLILPWPLWLRSGQLPCFFLVRFLCPVMKFRGATPTYATNERGLLKRSILPTTVMTRALIWVPTPRTLWSRRPRSSDITNSCRVWFNCPICRSRDLTASSKNNMALATGLVIKSTLASMLSRSFFKFLCPAAQGIPHCWAKALKLTMLFERCDISCCRTAKTEVISTFLVENFQKNVTEIPQDSPAFMQGRNAALKPRSYFFGEAGNK